jgi:hypothetical protein
VTPVAIARVDVTSVPVSRLVRAFPNVFCFALAGYALLGKSCAYLGLPIHPRNGSPQRLSQHTTFGPRRTPRSTHPPAGFPPQPMLTN